MAKPDFPVDILIREVHAAGVGGMTIDHKDLSVITVILARRDRRADRIEDPAADSLCLQLLRIVVGQVGKGVHAIIEDSYLYALFRLLLKDLQDRIPQDPF